MKVNMKKFLNFSVINKKLSFLQEDTGKIQKVGQLPQ